MLGAKWWRVRRLYWQARRYHQSGQLPQASALCRDAIRLDPEYVWPYLLQGQIFLERQHHGEARKYFQKALEIQEQPQSHYHLGAVALRAGLWSQAQTHFEQLIIHHPHFAEGYRGLGLAWLRQGHFERAWVCFRTAQNLAPDETRLSFHVAAAERAQACRPYLEQAQWPLPLDVQAYLEWGLVLLDERDDFDDIEDHEYTYDDVAGALARLTDCMKACGWPVSVVVPVDELSQPLAWAITQRHDCRVVSPQKVQRYDGVLVVNARARHTQALKELLRGIYSRTHLVWHFALHLPHLRGWSWETLPHLAGAVHSELFLPWEDLPQYQPTRDFAEEACPAQDEVFCAASEILYAWDDLVEWEAPKPLAPKYVSQRSYTGCLLDLSLQPQDLRIATLLWFGWQKLEHQAPIPWDQSGQYRLTITLQGEVEHLPKGLDQWSLVQQSADSVTWQSTAPWLPAHPAQLAQTGPWQGLTQLLSTYTPAGAFVTLQAQWCESNGLPPHVGLQLSGNWTGNRLALTRVGAWETPGWSLWQFRRAVQMARDCIWQTPNQPQELMAGRAIDCGDRHEAQVLAGRLELLLDGRALRIEGEDVMGDLSPDELAVAKTWQEIGRWLHQACQGRLFVDLPEPAAPLPRAQIFGHPLRENLSVQRSGALIWAWLGVSLVLGMLAFGFAGSALIWGWSDFHRCVALPVAFAAIINLALAMLASSWQPYPGLCLTRAPRWLNLIASWLDQGLLISMSATLGFWLLMEVFSPWQGVAAKSELAAPIFLGLTWVWLFPALGWLVWGTGSRLLTGLFYQWPAPFNHSKDFACLDGSERKAIAHGLLGGVGLSVGALWFLLTCAHLQLSCCRNWPGVAWTECFSWASLSIGILLGLSSFAVLRSRAGCAQYCGQLYFYARMLAAGVVGFGLFLCSQI